MKKLAYGQKAVKIMELLNSTNKSDREVARLVKCHPSYVTTLRKKMAHVEPCPEEVSKEAIKEVAYLTTCGTGRTPPEQDDITKVLRERGSRYGNFLDHARITQRLKNVAHQFASDNEKRFDVDQAEALDMIFHKIGRILNGDPNYADSWIDIAGYAKLVADRLEGKVR
jgi:hypothetical protein